MINDTGRHVRSESVCIANIDRTYRATPLYYLELIQESAARHSYELSLGIPQLVQEGLTWVLARNFLRVCHYAVWPEKVTVETWPCTTWKMIFPRATRAVNEHHVELFTSLSHWVVFNTTAGKPVRPDAIASRFGSQLENAPFGPDLGKRPQPGQYGMHTLATAGIQPMYTDTDSNYHVNNISYAAWMLGNLPDEFHDSHRMIEIDICHLIQTHHDDTLSTTTEAWTPEAFELGDTKLFHSIHRNRPDGTRELVCSASTTWASLNQPIES